MKTKVWQRSLGAWMFFPVAYLAYTSNASLLWLIPSFVLYITIALTVTVGYHRLFCHNAFVCSRFWHWFFGLTGCITLNAAPVHWSSVHINHHRYSDTDKDTYDSDFRHFLRFNEREGVQATKNELRMMRDPMHKMMLNHSLTISIAFAVALLLINFNAFIFLWALPTTTYLVTSGIHTIFAHGEKLKEGDSRRSSARNLWVLEYIIPMAGEWLHKEHHEKPKLMNWATKPYYFDLGAILIKLIEKKNAEQPT